MTAVVAAAVAVRMESIDGEVSDDDGDDGDNGVGGA